MARNSSQPMMFPFVFPERQNETILVQHPI